MNVSISAGFKKSLLIYTTALFLVSVFAGCALLTRPPLEPAIEKLSSIQVYFYGWSDDMDFMGLEQAVGRSISYYKRVPEDVAFEYNGLFYSPQEMVASMNLFVSIIRSYKGRERMSQLREKFLFFESRNSGGEAFFTGYYEPILEGSLTPAGKFTEPLYKTPADLIEADLGQFADKWKNERIVGRLQGKRLIPYDSRDEIVYGKTLHGRAEPIAYVNEIELFFLQIQGSGLIRLPEGSLKRVNYAGKNGHPYRAIGNILKDKIPPDKMSLQSIKAYLYANPDKAPEILNYNQSYTFFRETEEGPLGDIDVPLTPKRSIAMDTRVSPRGGLAYIDTKVPVFAGDRISGWMPVKRFVLVQDTGGAIRGHGRIDLFMGHGEKAEKIAGHLKQAGRSFLIVARKEFLHLK